MEKEFLIVDFTPQGDANVTTYALRQSLIGSKEAVAPSEIKYATENDYENRLIVQVDDVENSVFDGNTLLFAVDKEYEPRAISVVLYNDETGSIKAIEPIIELAGDKEEQAPVQPQEQEEAHEQGETSHEESEQKEASNEDSLEQTIETIVPSVGDLYERVNEPLHVDEQFLADREVLSLKTQLETSLSTIRFILGKEIDELIRDGKFEEAKRLVVEQLKQSPSSELLEYQSSLRALENQKEEVRMTVDEIKSSYDKRKQEAWEQEVLEYQARWEEEYRLANPDDSEVRAANYVLSQKPHIAELNQEVTNKKVAAEKDVMTAIVKSGGDSSTGRLLDFLRMKERYQNELDKITGAIAGNKRVVSTPVVEQPAFVEESHEEVAPVVEQEAHEELHQQLPDKEEATQISEDFDDLDAEFEKEFAALDAAPVSLESTPVVESQPEVTHEEVAHNDIVDEDDLFEDDFEDVEKESPEQHEDLGDSFDELGDEEEVHEEIAHDEDEEFESEDEDDFDDFAEYKEDEDEEVEAPKSNKKLGLGAKVGIGAGAVGLLAAIGVGGVMLLNPSNDQKANEPSTSEQAPAEKSEDTTVKPLVSVGDTLVITKADKKEYTVKVLEVLPDGSIYTDGGDNGEKIHITYEQLQKKFGQ
jgi:hypothetical very acidic protein